MDQLDLIDIYRTFHPQTMNFTFFTSAHGTFSRIYHILGISLTLVNSKKIEIISSLFSDHNAVRLDINSKKSNAKEHSNYRTIALISYASKVMLKFLQARFSNT